MGRLAGAGALVDLLDQNQLVAIALQYGVVGVRVSRRLQRDHRHEPFFTIDTKGYNLPKVHHYCDEGISWTRDVSEEGRAALFAASKLTRSAA